MLGVVSLELGEIIGTGNENVAVVRPWLFLKIHNDTNGVTTESSLETSLELPRDTRMTHLKGWKRASP